MTKVSAIIPAAGSGRRMGGNRSKQYLEIGDTPVIIATLSVFQNSPQIDEIIVVSPEAELSFSRELIESHSLSKVSAVVLGGRERQDSIRNGLDTLSASTDMVVIHDGVRPFIDSETIRETIVAAGEYGAAMAAVPVKDTVKEVAEGIVSRTVPRQNLWLAQTPQTFRYDIIREAYDAALEKGFYGTDDASLVEALGYEVRIVTGSYKNIKITTREDLLFAEAIIKERKTCVQG